MTDREKKTIDYFNTDVEYLEEGLKNPNYIGRFITIQDKEVEYLKTILNLIEKQEKVIDKLSWELSKNFCPDIDTTNIDCTTINCNECIKQYFYRKVEEDEPK